MPSEYIYVGAPLTIIISVAAMLVALVGIWIKDDVQKGFLTAGALLLSVIAGFGWSSNIMELLDVRSRLYSNLTACQKDVAAQKVKIAVLTQYKDAYELAVQSALTTGPTKEGDRTVFQTVMFNIPASFPGETIQKSCKDRIMVKDALDPLVAQGKIFAGDRPAWDALMNCALISKQTSQ